MRKAICLCLLLAGCSDWPEVSAASPDAAGLTTPALLTHDQLTAAQAQGEAATNDTGALLRRGAALRARAAALQALQSAP